MVSYHTLNILQYQTHYLHCLTHYLGPKQSISSFHGVGVQEKFPALRKVVTLSRVFHQWYKLKWVVGNTKFNIFCQCYRYPNVKTPQPYISPTQKVVFPEYLWNGKKLRAVKTMPLSMFSCGLIPNLTSALQNSISDMEQI